MYSKQKQIITKQKNIKNELTSFQRAKRLVIMLPVSIFVQIDKEPEHCDAKDLKKIEKSIERFSFLGEKLL